MGGTLSLARISGVAAQSATAALPPPLSHSHQNFL